MRDTRREFIKKAAMLSGGAGLFATLPPSIQKALAIDPLPGSTFMDAEHVVILMQENRSFDHCYGALQGVRGFNDPRTIHLPDNNLAWLQKNAAGETYSPFRLNIKETKSTWLGSLPHSWTNQVDARNNGKYDKWLIAKPSGKKAFANVPLTMGYYNREDIPFYYSLADAFTVCDQNFCSSLTGTTPNRLYLWTGTVREAHDANTQAKVRNEEVDYDREANWKTFPEQLEENNISWRIYQNEISLDSGLQGEEDAWLSNFTDNPIEWFSQYQVRFHETYRKHLVKLAETLPGEIQLLETQLRTAEAGGAAKMQKQLAQKKARLEKLKEERKKWTEENFQKLSQKEKNLHQKAFTTNTGDPDYRSLDTLHYSDGDIKRELKIPKGDVLHQFRTDVGSGNLPTVSWIVAPENFSDHPGAPWYGAWYVSEVMDILTRNPEVWKKTIFILCYDENDGYFDHVPPFVPPHPEKPGTGLVSKGIDVAEEYVSLEQDMKFKPEKEARESSIGLGYRVPLVIASPWSRGGAVCSQVFDHTSILQLIEKILSGKLGKKIEETNITAWRRAVCGDLTSVFKPYNGEKIKLPAFLGKMAVLESVHKAKFKKDPFGYNALTDEEVDLINRNPSSSLLMPRQEKGIRSSCALPYELYVDGSLNAASKKLEIQFRSGNEIFGPQSAGSPFNVYAPGNYAVSGDNAQRLYEAARTWAYAVAPGDQLQDEWPLDHFENDRYHLRVYGPNGFYRELIGNSADPMAEILLTYNRLKTDNKKLSGNVQLELINADPARKCMVQIKDNAYKSPAKSKILGAAGAADAKASVILDLGRSFGWYDFTVSISGAEIFSRRYAGRVETGVSGYTDPAMGNA